MVYKNRLAEADRAIGELSEKLADAEANQADARLATPKGIALAQTIFDQLGSSVGIADGVEGTRTTAGLNAFRDRVRLLLASTLDHETLAALKGAVAFAPESTELGEPAHEPVSSFTDCQACPEMVALPGGTFPMGSPDTELDRRTSGGPQTEVTIAALTEVTFDQWQAADLGILNRCAVERRSGERQGDSGKWFVSISLDSR